MKRPLQLSAVLFALVLTGVGSAQAASPIEGVWSLGGGKITVEADAGETFTGTVSSPARFSSCTHRVGEKVWQAITPQTDGSFWGRHQWFSGAKCAPISTLGPAAWRVLKTDSGSTYLIFCTSQPGGPQPKIDSAGHAENAAQCLHSGSIPNTSISTGPRGLIASASPSFDFTSTEAGTFECRLDSKSWVTCPAPKTYSGLADGSHKFEVRAITSTGDADPTPAVANFSVDTTAPTISISSTPSDPSASSSAAFTFAATETGSGVKEVQCSLAGVPFAKCTSDTAQSYSDLADGSHKFEVRAVDKAGNIGAPTPYSWTSDTTPPETTISSGPTGPIATTTATFVVGSSEAGSFECRLDSDADSGWSSCQTPITYNALGQGQHTFEVRARDPLGNTDQVPAIAEFSVDTEAPEIEIASGPDGPISSAGASFSFDSTEDGSFECRIDSTDESDWAPCTSPVTYTSLGDGPHTFEVRARDDLGNSDPVPAVASFTVDTHAPDTTITSAPTETISSASAAATFEFVASEPGSFECHMDSSATWSACTSPISFSALSEGSHAFEVRATDALGNTDSSPAATSFLVDTPINGQRLAIAPVSGKVKIQTPGSAKFRLLVEGETIPVGSIVDTTEGKARLVSIDADGLEQGADFFDGIFRIGQRQGRSVVTLKLRGGDFSACDAAAGSASASARRGGRRLWGSGHGNFRTEGHGGSATVRGTIWLTEDRCDGTLFKVRRGIVAVRDFLKGKTFSVPAGKSYFARDGG